MSSPLWDKVVERARDELDIQGLPWLRGPDAELAYTNKALWQPVMMGWYDGMMAHVHAMGISEQEWGALDPKSARSAFTTLYTILGDNLANGLTSLIKLKSPIEIQKDAYRRAIMGITMFLARGASLQYYGAMENLMRAGEISVADGIRHADTVTSAMEAMTKVGELGAFKPLRAQGTGAGPALIAGLVIAAVVTYIGLAFIVAMTFLIMRWQDKAEAACKHLAQRGDLEHASECYKQLDPLAKDPFKLGSMTNAIGWTVGGALALGIVVYVVLPELSRQSTTRRIRKDLFG